MKEIRAFDSFNKAFPFTLDNELKADDFKLEKDSLADGKHIWFVTMKEGVNIEK